MFELLQISESHELSDALEKLGQEAARLQTVIDTVPSFLWTSLPDGSKEYLNKRWYQYTGLTLEQGKGWVGRWSFTPMTWIGSYMNGSPPWAELEQVVLGRPKLLLPTRGLGAAAAASRPGHQRLNQIQ